MQIFLPNSRRCTAQAGFTLVELLIVLFLIGIATTAVMLASGGAGRAGASEAERLAARMAAARDAAVIEGRSHAIWVRASGYGFERREADGWHASTEPALAPAIWPRGTQAAIAPGQTQRIIFTPSGLPANPAAIRIVTPAQGTSWTVQIDAAGEVTLAR